MTAPIRIRRERIGKHQHGTRANKLQQYRSSDRSAYYLAPVHHGRHLLSHHPKPPQNHPLVCTNQQ